MSDPRVEVRRTKAGWVLTLIDEAGSIHRTSTIVSPLRMFEELARILGSELNREVPR